MTTAHFFTWAEANQLVPRLAEIFGVVAQLRPQLRAIYEQLDQLGAPPGGPPPGGPVSPDVRRLRALFQGLYETLTEQLREIEAMGGMIKDVDRGLVDFLYRRDGREVLLCWCYGEAEIGFWHDLEAGFAGRRPIEDRDRAGRTGLH
ncbi:MAG TPA: DUF2203 domain-containing protein [Polyangia bacterium]|nr:DUF2203 domain-containing protein [Polyangia bacterium]